MVDSESLEQDVLYPKEYFSQSLTYNKWLPIACLDIRMCLKAYRDLYLDDKSPIVGEDRGPFFFRNHPINYVCVTGYCSDVILHKSNDRVFAYTFTVSDGTGATIECFKPETLAKEWYETYRNKVVEVKGYLYQKGHFPLQIKVRDIGCLKATKFNIRYMTLAGEELVKVRQEILAQRWICRVAGLASTDDSVDKDPVEFCSLSRQPSNLISHSSFSESIQKSQDGDDISEDKEVLNSNDGADDMTLMGTEPGSSNPLGPSQTTLVNDDPILSQQVKKIALNSRTNESDMTNSDSESSTKSASHSSSPVTRDISMNKKEVAYLDNEIFKGIEQIAKKYEPESFERSGNYFKATVRSSGSLAVVQNKKKKQTASRFSTLVHKTRKPMSDETEKYINRILSSYPKAHATKQRKFLSGAIYSLQLLGDVDPKQPEVSSVVCVPITSKKKLVGGLLDCEGIFVKRLIDQLPKSLNGRDCGLRSSEDTGYDLTSESAFKELSSQYVLSLPTPFTKELDLYYEVAHPEDLLKYRWYLTEKVWSRLHANILGFIDAQNNHCFPTNLTRSESASSARDSLLKHLFEVSYFLCRTYPKTNQRRDPFIVNEKMKSLDTEFFSPKKVKKVLWNALRTMVETGHIVELNGKFQTIGLWNIGDAVQEEMDIVRNCSNLNPSAVLRSRDVLTALRHKRPQWGKVRWQRITSIIDGYLTGKNFINDEQWLPVREGEWKFVA